MSTIGIPDVSSLPVESNQSQYDLRRAATDLAPEVAPPSIGPQEAAPPSAYQLPPEAFQQAPQFSQPSGFDQLQVQPLHVAASALADQVKQQNMQQGRGVMKHLMTSFLGGMGRSMMVHAGLPTPEQEQDQRMMKIAALTNAQSELDLRNAQIASHRMEVLPATLLDPRTGAPVPGPDGRPITGPKWQIEKMQQGLVEKMNQRAQNLTPEQQLYASYKQQGLTDEQATQRMIELKDKGQAPTETSLALRAVQGDPTAEAALKRLDKSKREARPINQFQMPSNVTPEAAATGGEAVLKGLDPGKAQLVRKIADYTLDPAKVTSMRSGERAQVMGLVSLYDKTYDQKLYPARSKVQLDFTSGKTADNITALNTAADHLSQLHDAGVALKNGDIQALNMIGNAYRVETGGSAPVVFDAIKNAVAGELEKAFKGASATDVGTANVLNTIRTNASPEQITSVAATDIHLMKSRLNALEQRYQNGMGKSAPPGLITYPNSEQIFSRIGDTPQSATGPNGHKIVVRDGKWVDAKTGAPI